MNELLISKGGQISIPATIRHRWRTQRVLIEDRGDTIVLRPLPADPIGAARGSMRVKGRRTRSDDAVRRARLDDAKASDRRAVQR